ncbi:MAG: hypothetical protein AAFR53_00935 [Pseudomonadota bacterium]
MADTTALPTTRVAPLAAIATLFAASIPALSDKAMKDAGITRADERPPLSQDAATALHLQALGKWY